jgi:hypothetical protein
MMIEDLFSRTGNMMALSLDAMRNQLSEFDKLIEDLNVRRDVLAHAIAFNERAQITVTSLPADAKLSLSDGAKMPAVARPKIAVPEGADQPVNLDAGSGPAQGGGPIPKPEGSAAPIGDYGVPYIWDEGSGQFVPDFVGEEVARAASKPQAKAK